MQNIYFAMCKLNVRHINNFTAMGRPEPGQCIKDAYTHSTKDPTQLYTGGIKFRLPGSQALRFNFAKII